MVPLSPCSKGLPCLESFLTTPAMEWTVFFGHFSGVSFYHFYFPYLICLGLKGTHENQQVPVLWDLKGLEKKQAEAEIVDALKDPSFCLAGVFGSGQVWGAGVHELLSAVVVRTRGWHSECEESQLGQEEFEARLQILFKSSKRGTQMAQSVKEPALDFSSNHDLPAPFQAPRSLLVPLPLPSSHALFLSNK